MKNMKKYLFALLIVVPLLVGCDSLSKLTMFELPFDQSVTFPAMPALNTPIPLEITGIKTNIDSVLTSLKLKSDMIQAVKLKKMDFTLSSPADGDLSFLKSVEIFITGEGLDDVKIASTGDVTTNTKNVSLALEDVDLKDFILKDKFGLKIITTTDKATSKEQKINISFKFLVDLKVLGL